MESHCERIANEILMYFRSLKKTSQDVSISEPVDIDKDGNALTFIDIISSEGNIVDEIDLKIKSEQLRKYIKEELDSREQTIIALRYGLGAEDELTQREVAAKLNISRSYVSRIEKKALAKLCKRFEQ